NWSPALVSDFDRAVRGSEHSENWSPTSDLNNQLASTFSEDARSGPKSRQGSFASGDDPAPIPAHAQSWNGSGSRRGGGAQRENKPPVDPRVVARPASRGGSERSHLSQRSQVVQAASQPSKKDIGQVYDALREQKTAIKTLRNVLHELKMESQQSEVRDLGGIPGMARRVKQMGNILDKISSAPSTPLEGHTPKEGGTAEHSRQPSVSVADSEANSLRGRMPPSRVMQEHGKHLGSGLAPGSDAWSDSDAAANERRYPEFETESDLVSLGDRLDSETDEVTQAVRSGPVAHQNLEYHIAGSHLSRPRSETSVADDVQSLRSDIIHEVSSMLDGRFKDVSRREKTMEAYMADFESRYAAMERKMKDKIESLRDHRRSQSQSSEMTDLQLLQVQKRCRDLEKKLEAKTSDFDHITSTMAELKRAFQKQSTDARGGERRLEKKFDELRASRASSSSRQRKESVSADLIETRCSELEEKVKEKLTEVVTEAATRATQLRDHFDGQFEKLHGNEVKLSEKLEAVEGTIPKLSSTVELVQKEVDEKLQEIGRTTEVISSQDVQYAASVESRLRILESQMQGKANGGDVATALSALKLEAELTAEALSTAKADAAASVVRAELVASGDQFDQAWEAIRPTVNALVATVKDTVEPSIQALQQMLSAEKEKTRVIMDTTQVVRVLMDSVQEQLQTEDARISQLESSQGDTKAHIEAIEPSIQKALEEMRASQPPKSQSVPNLQDKQGQNSVDEKRILQLESAQRDTMSQLETVKEAIEPSLQALQHTLVADQIVTNNLQDVRTLVEAVQGQIRTDEERITQLEAAQKDALSHFDTIKESTETSIQTLHEMLIAGQTRTRSVPNITQDTPVQETFDEERMLQLEAAQRDVVAQIETVKGSIEPSMQLLQEKTQQISAALDGVRELVDTQASIEAERISQVESGNTDAISRITALKDVIKPAIQAIEQTLMADRQHTQSVSITLQDVRSLVEAIQVQTLTDEERISQLEAAQKNTDLQIETVRETIEPSIQTAIQHLRTVDQEKPLVVTDSAQDVGGQVSTHEERMLQLEVSQREAMAQIEIVKKSFEPSIQNLRESIEPTIQGLQQTLVADQQKTHFVSNALEDVRLLVEAVRSQACAGEERIAQLEVAQQKALSLETVKETVEPSIEALRRAQLGDQEKVEQVSNTLQEVQVIVQSVQDRARTDEERFSQLESAQKENISHIEAVKADIGTVKEIIEPSIQALQQTQTEEQEKTQVLSNTLEEIKSLVEAVESQSRTDQVRISQLESAQIDPMSLEIVKEAIEPSILALQQAQIADQQKAETLSSTLQDVKLLAEAVQVQALSDEARISHLESAQKDGIDPAIQTLQQTLIDDQQKAQVVASTLQDVQLLVDAVQNQARTEEQRITQLELDQKSALSLEVVKEALEPSIQALQETSQIATSSLQDVRLQLDSVGSQVRSAEERLSQLETVQKDALSMDIVKEAIEPSLQTLRATLIAEQEKAQIASNSLQDVRLVAESVQSQIRIDEDRISHIESAQRDTLSQIETTKAILKSNEDELKSSGAALARRVDALDDLIQESAAKLASVTRSTAQETVDRSEADERLMASVGSLEKRIHLVDTAYKQADIAIDTELRTILSRCNTLDAHVASLQGSVTSDSKTLSEKPSLELLNVRFADAASLRDAQKEIRGLHERINNDSRLQTLESSLQTFTARMSEYRTVDATQASFVEKEIKRISESVINDDARLRAIETSVATLSEQTVERSSLTSLQAELRALSEKTADRSQVASLEAEIKRASDEKIADRSKVSSLETDVQRAFDERTADRSKVASLENEIQRVSSSLSKLDKVGELEGSLAAMSSRWQSDPRFQDLQMIISGLQGRLPEAERITVLEASVRDIRASQIPESRVRELDNALTDLKNKVPDQSRLNTMEATLRDLPSKYAEDSRIRTVEEDIRGLKSSTTSGLVLKELRLAVEEATTKAEEAVIVQRTSDTVARRAVDDLNNRIKIIETDTSKQMAETTRVWQHIHSAAISQPQPQQPQHSHYPVQNDFMMQQPNKDRHSMSVLSSRIESLETRVETTELASTTTKHELRQINSELADVSSETEEQKRRLRKAEEQHAHHLTEQSTARKSLEQMQSDARLIAEKTHGLDRRVKEVEGTISNVIITDLALLGDELAGARSAFEDSAKDIRRLGGRLTASDNRLDELYSTRTVAEADVARLSTQMTLLQGNNTANTVACGKVSEDVLVFAGKLEDLAASRTTITAQVSKLTSDVTSLQTKGEEVRVVLGSALEKTKSVTRQVNDMQNWQQNHASKYASDITELRQAEAGNTKSGRSALSAISAIGTRLEEIDESRAAMTKFVSQIADDLTTLHAADKDLQIDTHLALGRLDRLEVRADDTDEFRASTEQDLTRMMDEVRHIRSVEASSSADKKAALEMSGRFESLLADLAKVHRLAQDVTALQQGDAHHDEGLQEIKSHVVALEKKLGSIVSVPEIANDLTALQGAQDTTAQEIGKIISQLQSFDGKHQLAVTRIKDVERTLGGVESVSDLFKDVACLREESNENVTSIQKVFDGLVSMNRDNRDFGARLADVESSLGAVRDVTQLANEVIALRTDYDKNKMGTQNLTSRLNELDSLHEKAVVKVTEDLTKLRGMTEDVKRWRDGTAAQIEVLETAQQDIASKVTGITTKLAASTADNTNWRQSTQKKLLAIEQKQTSMTTDIEVAESKHEELAAETIRQSQSRLDQAATVDRQLQTVKTTITSTESRVVRRVNEEMDRWTKEMLQKLSVIKQSHQDLKGLVERVEKASEETVRNELDKWTRPTSDRVTTLEHSQRDLGVSLNNLRGLSDKTEILAANIENLRADVKTLNRDVHIKPSNLRDFRVPAFEGDLSSVGDDQSIGGAAPAAGKVYLSRGGGGVNDRYIASLRKSLDKKVDTAVLEELMRHLPTRDEVRSLIGKHSSGATTDSAAADVEISNALKKMKKELSFLKKEGEKQPESRRSMLDAVLPEVRAYVKEFLADNADPSDLASARRELESKLRKDLKQWLEKRLKETGSEHAERIERITTNIRDELFSTGAAAPRNGRDKDRCCPAGQDSQTSESSVVGYNDRDLDKLSRRLTRDFDEKLFMVCSDVSACKATFAQQVAQQPFLRYGQWLWKSGTLKQGGAVPWNFETNNNDPENFKWDRDSINIRVAEAGLYEISFAFFTKSKPSIQLVVNGESVLSAINSPSYVVHHSSGFVTDGQGRVEEGTCTGISLLDFLSLPPKSTLSVHYQGAKKGTMGHGFLGLRKL
ncbi:hypothetical protein HKX48_003142, partial [Thoreauomyces humboldtii]